MEMTIDEAINHLGNYSSTNGSGLTTDKQHNEAKRVAIDTMRKYQKIKDIVNKPYDTFYSENYYGYFLRVQDIRKVIQYGNDD